MCLVATYEPINMSSYAKDLLTSYNIGASFWGNMCPRPIANQIIVFSIYWLAPFFGLGALIVASKFYCRHGAIDSNQYLEHEYTWFTTSLHVVSYIRGSVGKGYGSTTYVYITGRCVVIVEGGWGKVEGKIFFC